jgi:hypothetical protein
MENDIRETLKHYQIIPDRFNTPSYKRMECAHPQLHLHASDSMSQ